MSDDTIDVPKMPSADEALREAIGNIRAAERFFNHGMHEKSYNAAYIAEKWAAIANALHIREQSVRWESTLPIVPPQDVVNTEPSTSASAAPPHTHSAECTHNWIYKGSSVRCLNECETPYRHEIKRAFCPAVCPDGESAQ